MDLGSDLDKSIKTLRKTVESLVTSRHVSGTYPLDTGKVGLFYRNDSGSKAGWIGFASPDGVPNSKLEDLVAVCEEAKFGLGNKDVLDPSYRKAWKLDASKFALQFDLVNSGILETVHDALLHYEASSLALEAHLDKMNVYGPGSFFKSHVDTPRNKNMIATLVIVLPTEHKGGDLLLMNKHWTFDSANMVSKDATKDPRLAFVSFYSDIDHEVTPVESGYRVTVTYNLYCSKPLSPSIPKVSLRVSPEEKLVREAIRWILEKDEVLPKGGVIAFGLTYKYPIDPRDIKSLDTTFQGLLKGGDALIERACQGLNLDLKVRALYMTSADGDPTGGSKNRYYGDEIRYLTRTTSIDTPEDASEDSEEYLREALDAVGYAAKDYDYSHKKSKKKPVLWLTRPEGLLETSAPWMAYGNEASMSYIYGRLVLTAEVPAFDQRKAIFDGTLDKSDAESEDSSEGTDTEDY
ncbi:hypothetical protein BKA70DRAFT_1181228 [Coprinopsis sp. MPI-PUGE-AT-0042]|nr:hypothetical protein BKA70DRAFT_1181228 [Coprinopsis sp. MPI-PUGE-AT-0042]